MFDEILTARDVMKLLKISENTLLRLESDLIIKPDFRLGNRKRYYKSNLLKQVNK
jgi:DNA-binding transcriptional MerR regulator